MLVTPWDDLHTLDKYSLTFRGSRLQIMIKTGVFKNFAIFSEKHLSVVINGAT